MNKFTFNTHNAHNNAQSGFIKKIDLDNINIIDIENSETFHRTPILQHNLDIIVKNPGIYKMSEIAKT